MDSQNRKKVIINIGILLLAVALIVVLVVTNKRGMNNDPVSTGQVEVETQVTNSEQTGWLMFTNSNPNFSIMYPEGFTVDSAHVYNALGPGKDISGIAFTVPSNMTKGTNLSADTSLSVEFPKAATECNPMSYLSSAVTERTVTENGVKYTVVQGADTAVGNHYEETLYVNEDCSMIVRYYVHSTNVMAYDPGTVVAFDSVALMRTFDQMRTTLKLE